MKETRGSQEISETYHQFQYYFVLFRLLRYAVFGIEVFLVIQPEVCAECFAEAEGDATCQALAFVVGHRQSAGFLIGGFGVAGCAFTMIGSTGPTAGQLYIVFRSR